MRLLQPVFFLAGYKCDVSGDPELSDYLEPAVIPKIQQTKMLVMCQRFGDLFLFGLVWQLSFVRSKFDKGRFKVIAA